MSELPSICRHGKTAFEKKLLLYYHTKQEGYRFELRYPDSTLYAPEHLPKLQHPVEFIPLWEIASRLFLFKTHDDRNKAKDHLDGYTVQPKRRRAKSNRRPRKKDRG